jgi:predicted site-specific integrase-resolvase
MPLNTPAEVSAADRAIAGLGRILNYQAVAEGLDISLATARRWTQRSKNPLPVLRVGYNTVRVSESQLAAWLETQKG